MANYQNLKAAISAAIRTNGNQEITGQKLQNVLNSIVSVIGANYTFAGVATPATNPGTPDQNVFYIATQGGTYTNFGATALPEGISLLMWNGSWTAKTIMYNDGGVFDISVYKSTGGTLAKFADLGAALGTNGANIPAAARKGGMSIKFVQSSDNKYVQYRLTADDWSTDTEDWAIAEEGVYVENPEFVRVVLDNENKILEAIMKDGTKILPAGAKVIGTAEYDGATIKTVENPEFVGVWLDGEDKILFGVEQDGNFLFGCGVPRQVKEYIEQKIEELSLDEYESIVNFIGDYLNNTTLEELLSKKVDGEYVDNPEFIEAKTDADDKLIEATKKDGTKVIGGDLNVGGSAKILGNMEVYGVSYKVIENPEYLAAWLDAEEKVIFGFKTDGKTYVGDADFLNDLENIKAFIQNITDKDIDWDALSSITTAENPEYIEAKTDSEGKLLAGRTTDGAAFEKVGFSTPKVSIDGHIIEDIEDPESRYEITIDSEDKIVSYRKDDGTKVENVGFETPSVSTDSLNLSESGMIEFQQDLKDNGFKPASPDIKYNLPKYGTVNIKQETFYLSQGNYTDKNDLEVRQELPDTDENAAAGLTIAHYYIKNTNTRLDFYAASKVTKIENKYYVISSLEDGQVVPSSIEVTQIIDKPDVRTWPVDKKTEHYCLVDINFGYFLTKTNVCIGVKFQGSSSLYNRKRNLRFTFYKNSAKPYYPVDGDKLGKKDKIKIGELLRLSGFNLKANWSDNSRIKEIILYRVIIDVWKARPICDRFPWDKDFGFYTGATGTINGFPIRLELGEEFYGLDVFALKKDEKNYMLDGDDDHSGIFVCGSHRDSTNWKHSYPSHWEDEMMDEMSQETETALYNFLEFISTMFEGSDGNSYKWYELTYFVDNSAYDYSKVGNKNDKIYLYQEYGGNEITDVYVTSTLVNGAPVEDSVKAEFVGLNESDIKERMDIQGWMDYFICMQTFLMWDSICRNMILHTRSDKKKFYPYFYDLDLSLRHEYNADIFDIAYDTIDGQRRTNDMTLWENLKDIYWDQIVNRYCELRKTVLNTEYITALYHDIADSIPDADYASENEKWNKNTSKYVFEGLIFEINKRLAWLDENYFIV